MVLVAGNPTPDSSRSLGMTVMQRDHAWGTFSGIEEFLGGFAKVAAEVGVGDGY